MKTPKIKIGYRGNSLTHWTFVEIDGIEIPELTSVHYEHTVQSPARITLDMNAFDVDEIELNAEVVINVATYRSGYRIEVESEKSDIDGVEHCKTVYRMVEDDRENSNEIGDR
jgi:hypothetical protein